jgi:hypothetical protein
LDGALVASEMFFCGAGLAVNFVDGRENLKYGGVAYK